MNIKDSVTFSRVRTEVEFFWVNGNICCEWCNKSYRNRKGHIECFETHEEMADPGRGIGFYCPAREAIERMLENEISAASRG